MVLHGISLFCMVLHRLHGVVQLNWRASELPRSASGHLNICHALIEMYRTMPLLRPQGQLQTFKLTSLFCFVTTLLEATKDDLRHAVRQSSLQSMYWLSKTKEVGLSKKQVGHGPMTWIS